jgi:hypothetical protein
MAKQRICRRTLLRVSLQTEFDEVPTLGGEIIFGKIQVLLIRNLQKRIGEIRYPSHALRLS